MPFNLEHTIPRTPDDVWRIMTDWKVAEYWMGVTKLRPVAPDKKPRVGTRLSYQVRGAHHQVDVTAWDPPTRLGLAAQQGGLTVHYDYRLEVNESGTRIVLLAACRADKQPWKSIAPLMDLAMRWSDRNQLVALDKLVRITTGSGT